MRERVRANDLSVLFICPSDEWGTLERRAINDCHYLRDIGGNPVLYCIKGSPIDRQAQNFSLPRQFYKGKKVNKIFDLTYFLDLRRVIDENKFDLVHCFRLDYVWTISFLLMTKPHLPLILTFNRFVHKSYDSFVERWLLKRVDLVMTFSGSVRSVVLRNLPINPRKVHVVGAGIETYQKPCEHTHDSKVIGCFLTNKSQIENLNAFLYLIQPLNSELTNQSFKLKFMIFSDRQLEEMISRKDLEQFILELEAQDLVHIVETDTAYDAIKKMDIYISLAFNEPFSDLEIMANLYKKPVISPRTASRKQFLNKFQDIGETFYFQDARELRDRVSGILQHEQRYKLALDDNFEKLKITHGLDTYVEKVYMQYIKLYSQRLRFVSLRAKSN